MAGFIDTTRPEKFNGNNSKRWSSKVLLWFDSMNIWETLLGKPKGELTAQEYIRFDDAWNVS
jgi:hypothetical protein